MFLSKKCGHFGLATLSLISGFAMAQSTPPIDYDYAEVRYLNSDIDGLDGDGVEIAGSYQFDAEWLVRGSYSSQDFDFGAELDLLELGIGYKLPQLNAFDIVGYVSLIDASFARGGDTGFRFGAEGRTMLTSELEGRASINYIDIDDSDVFIELGVDYFFAPNISAGGEIQLGSDTDTISVGARWYYGR